MPDTATRKVVYLLGAGATHAELMNLDPDLTDGLRGLLVSNLSSRVIDKARRDPRYLKGVEMVSGTSGSLNIELLITLIENSKIHNWARKTSRLKQLVEQDIKSILTASRMRRFYLHKALLELHERATTKRQEQLTALITLNYDGNRPAFPWRVRTRLGDGRREGRRRVAGAAECAPAESRARSEG
jgi:hypothetical protein